MVGLTEKDHATLIGVHGGRSQLFVTDVVFKGDGIRSRAVDINAQRQSYCRGAGPWSAHSCSVPCCDTFVRGGIIGSVRSALRMV